jgi:hypothetical protein
VNAGKSSNDPSRGAERPGLPDCYGTVDQDVIAFCGSQSGRVWVDSGSGAGGLGLALLEALPDAVMILNIRRKWIT